MKWEGSKWSVIGVPFLGQKDSEKKGYEYSRSPHLSSLYLVVYDPFNPPPISLQPIIAFEIVCIISSFCRCF